MPNKLKLNDYEPVNRPRRNSIFREKEVEDVRKEIHATTSTRPEHVMPLSHSREPVGSRKASKIKSRLNATKTETFTTENWITRRGHAVSFGGLFVFTFLVYFRPYELFPSLSWLSKSAFVVALFTLAAFIPSQLGLENRITAKPQEVKLVLALLVTGLLSIPLAVEPGRAVEGFVEYLKVVVMFVVMVNVVRTEKRLRALILLVLFASCVLSLAALNDYRLGNLALQGRRIAGLIGGLFSNPNDLALHLVTMIPISLALMLGARGISRKLVYLGCSLLLMAGMVATFSRGGFLGFICVMAFLVWKLAPRNRVIFGTVALTAILATIAVAPSAYRSRLATTNDASALARTDDLKRSILVAARHPVFGIGMDNYIIYSNTNKTTHNSYTQVAAEMGFAAFLIYLTFLITPFSRLRRIEKDLYTGKSMSRLYYLAIGLQASLVAYMVVSFFASVAYLWYAYYLVAYSVALRRLCSSSEAANALSPKRRQSPSKTASPNRRSAIRPVGNVVAGGN